MKTAEEWSTDIANQNLERKPMVWPSDHLLLVRAIQLDAIKHGMTLAAQQCDVIRRDLEGCPIGSMEAATCHGHILNFRDKFKL